MRDGTVPVKVGLVKLCDLECRYKPCSVMVFKRSSEEAAAATANVRERVQRRRSTHRNASEFSWHWSIRSNDVHDYGSGILTISKSIPATAGTNFVKTILSGGVTWRGFRS